MLTIIEEILLHSSKSFISLEHHRLGALLSPAGGPCEVLCSRRSFCSGQKWSTYEQYVNNFGVNLTTLYELVEVLS